VNPTVRLAFGEADSNICENIVIRIHKETGLPTWFGNVTSAWGRSTHHGATEPPFRGDDDSYHPPPLYGDGEVIEKKYLDLALKLAESNQVLVKWQKGDLVLLDVSDNMRLVDIWTFCLHKISPWNCTDQTFRTSQSCIQGGLGRAKDRSWLRCGIRRVAWKTTPRVVLS
jgi:hypothetical protein